MAHDLAAAEDRVPAVREELARQVESQCHDVQRDNREEQRLAKAPSAEAPALSSQDAAARQRRRNAPVRDRLGVLDHPSQIELARASSGHDRKAGPGWT